MNGFGIDVSEPGLIVVDGEIDASNSADFEALIRQVNGDLRLDLRACRFMDSSGLAVLAQARSLSDSLGHTLTLIAPSSPVLRLLEVCGMTELFTIEDPGNVQV